MVHLVKPPSQPGIIVPRWVSIALGEIGIVEDVRPGKSHPRIEEYHTYTRGGIALDDVPWCSSFCCFCMENSGITSTKSKTAATWATWGYACLPRAFAVVVFPKTDKDAGGSGHVAIALGVSGREVYVVGGNQANKVSIAVREKKHAVWRWPYALPTAGTQVGG